MLKGLGHVGGLRFSGLGGTHEPTNGFRMTEVGEGDWFCVVVVFGWTISMLFTGAVQGVGGNWGECVSRARVRQQQTSILQY